MPRTFKSWRSFWDFNHVVRRKLRYVRAPEHEEFLKAVAETSHSRKVVMKEGFVLGAPSLVMSTGRSTRATRFLKSSALIRPRE